MSDRLLYPSPIETAIARIEPLLNTENRISRRSIALLLLQKDPILRAQLQQEPYFPRLKGLLSKHSLVLSNLYL